jgi:hypothetical protein
MADRFLIDGQWYELAADGEYYRLYAIKGTPTQGLVVEVNADNVPEFVIAGSSGFAGEPSEGDVLLWLDGRPTWVTPDTPITFDGFAQGFGDAFGED